MSSTPKLDAHERPPLCLTNLFKVYRAYNNEDQVSNESILDFGRKENEAFSQVKLSGKLGSADLERIFQDFQELKISETFELEDVFVYSHLSLPGLLILPSLLPPLVQKTLLSRLLHRDFSNPQHQTNLHKHYNVLYPSSGETAGEQGNVYRPNEKSFFSFSPSSEILFPPKYSEIHKPLSISKALEKGFRWITLGGQYDWTAKLYPAEKPPEFPRDIGKLLKDLFPEMDPQAAIVNLYTAGDTLSLHRDVSEESGKGLVSVSLGCDCLFMIGLGNDPSDCVMVRLRSGDGLFMSGDARFAWHGVPKILPNTCPSYLEDWPAEGTNYQEWRGWMSHKRVNLNVRQMHD